MTSNEQLVVNKKPKRGFGTSTHNQGTDTAKTRGAYELAHESANNVENLIRQGKLHEAELLCNQLIARDPNNYILYSILGSLFSARGDHISAESSYRKAININPNSTDDLCNLGDLLKESGDYESAKYFYLESVKADKFCLRGHYNLGLMHKETGNLNDAIASFKIVARHKPDLAEAHISIGAILQEQGQPSAAITSLRTALHYQPHSAQAHNNLGLSLGSLGDYKAAINALQNAVNIKPEFAEAHNNLGLALHKAGSLNDAITSFKKALNLRNNFAEAHNNLGLALQEKGELQNAMSSFKTSLQINPHLLEVKCNLSMLELLTGDYNQGLENYEFRFSTKAGCNVLLAKPELPEWDGSSLNIGQKLLLISEQGLGDTMHFMRYVHTLRERGVDVHLCAQPKLHELIQASGIDPSPMTPQGALDSKHGQWIPLLSVPRYLGVTPENPLTNSPYIKAPDSLVMTWRDRLSKENRPIIGINWQGNPDHEKSNSAGRSLPLESFAPVANLEDLTLLSLQKGFGSEQLDQCSFRDRFVQCQDQINATWGFLETAAIIANCDLVITSDTSVAHLAGGMGKTTWLLLKQVPEWRWGIDGETTFWYPSMRLFRQTERGNWNGVMEQIVKALSQTTGTPETYGRKKANSQ